MNDESFIEGLVPDQDEIQDTLGPYQILKTIGKGGMGEVLSAYDTSCGRRIALKKIRADLIDHKQIHNRFLKEAKITCQLTHPAIIPIYVIEKQGIPYYTMPLVQGETLKQILRKTRHQEKQGLPLDHLGGSIPALIRIFITVCQAVAYAHSKKVLHRDLKPENIMIGSYGEVYILDWGLAEIYDTDESLPSHSQQKHHMTYIGKVVGTISYMAPERALGTPATIATDIYSLGVILYQILTLRNPFRRGTLKEFRKTIEKEILNDPQEIAPYRDIPPILSTIAKKCLEKNPKERYPSVDALIHDLENYIEGRSEWFQLAELDCENKQDWEFQEHVLIAEHVAITRSIETSTWVTLMISKASFSENTRLDATVRVTKESEGIGFLISAPEVEERQHVNDGFCLWIGTEKNRQTRLFKSTVEVLAAPDCFLKENEWVHVRIEKIGNNLFFYLNKQMQFSYISYLPMTGTHVGVMLRDTKVAIEDLYVSVASLNLTVNCLAVPDAFLSHKHFDAALTEYRRIGYSFPGRQEGREALFRAGITLLEQAKSVKKDQELFTLALEEFEKLHQTPGAPLEYLGKSLVYDAMGESEEEYKCLELALRRYPNHPLKSIIEAHAGFRLQKSARVNRLSTYQFALIILRHMPDLRESSSIKKLFKSLMRHWEPLSFIQTYHSQITPDENARHLKIQIAFWLAKPYALIEIFEEIQESFLKENALFSLIELGAWSLAKKLTPQNPLIKILIQCHNESITTAIPNFISELGAPVGQLEIQTALHLMQNALDLNEPKAVLELAERLPTHFSIEMLKIWALLQAKAWESAGRLLQQFRVDDLSDDESILFTLYGCFLAASEGKEIAEAHFGGLLETSYPRTTSLLGHYLNEQLNQGWMKEAFLWEKKQLWRQLSLYYHCLGDPSKAYFYQDLANQEVVI